ncbi:MAG: IS66 family insertion sequence element accessory protein TnpB [Bdellovibrionaceae bacterium]|nr:IS66 family insertion sequence element accessory protein TnpB [Pseudobdellovibrionaceae bacterium]
MSIRLRSGHRVFIYSDYQDLRAGFDSLAMVVREKMKRDLLEGDLFIFIGRNRKRLKALCYDGTGLLLFAKRLERGQFMALDRLEDFEITIEEMDQLLCGGYVRRRRFGEEALTLPRSQVSIHCYETPGARDQPGSFA